MVFLRRPSHEVVITWFGQHKSLALFMGTRDRAALGPHGPPNADVFFADANFTFYNKHCQDFADIWNVKLF